MVRLGAVISGNDSDWQKWVERRPPKGFTKLLAVLGANSHIVNNNSWIWIFAVMDYFDPSLLETVKLCGYEIYSISSFGSKPKVAFVHKDYAKYLRSVKEK